MATSPDKKGVCLSTAEEQETPEPLKNIQQQQRRGKGRPRTKPDRAMADKAYASKANRKLLRDRGIEAVIPEKSDHIANRKRLGAKGGRGPVPVLRDRLGAARRATALARPPQERANLALFEMPRRRPPMRPKRPSSYF